MLSNSGTWTENGSALILLRASKKNEMLNFQMTKPSYISRNWRLADLSSVWWKELAYIYINAQKMRAGARFCESSSCQTSPAEAGLALSHSSWRMRVRIAFRVVYKDFSEAASIWGEQKTLTHAYKTHMFILYVQHAPCVHTHLSEDFYCLVEKTRLHVFRHRQEMSSTVEDAQQSESVALSTRRDDNVTLYDTSCLTHWYLLKVIT